MKLRKLLLPTIALGATILIAMPSPSDAYSTLGFNLVPNQANFRVFNNFLDSQANNNTTPDDQFPGYSGATMAIWKACVEWASESHGDGSGDPHQSVLGSGGSNFDPMFNGEVGGVGIIGNNIHSALDQSNGGVLAFMQGGSTGWWVRYYDGWTWHDGPGTGAGYPDLQAVACHEHGHALGLGHSSDSSATMYGSGGSVSDRSIELDDINGIKSIYGSKNLSGTKPRITAVDSLSGQIEITGTNFTLNNNEVWFTRLTPGTTASGEQPIKVTGVASTNGNTKILINVPITAGPGDVIVKRNSSTMASTSNPFPFDPFSGSPPTAAITDVFPPRVPALATNGTSSVTLTGSGFTGATKLEVDSKTVGDPASSFSGSWTIVSDTQINFTMPLCNFLGTLGIFLTTPGGIVTNSIVVLEPSSPKLIAEQDDIVQAVGLDFAVGADNGDIILLKFSGLGGPTSIPGILEFEIGSNNLNQIFNVKTFNIGLKSWRKQHFGPFSGLDLGIEVFFEGMVIPIATGYGFPFDSTNAISLIITG